MVQNCGGTKPERQIAITLHANSINRHAACSCVEDCETRAEAHEECPPESKSGIRCGYANSVLTYTEAQERFW